MGSVRRPFTLRSSFIVNLESARACADEIQGAMEGEEEGGRAHRSETMYLLSVMNSEVFDNYLFLPISSLTTKVNIIVLLRKQIKIC